MDYSGALAHWHEHDAIAQEEESRRYFGEALTLKGDEEEERSTLLEQSYGSEEAPIQDEVAECSDPGPTSIPNPYDTFKDIFFNDMLDDTQLARYDRKYRLKDANKRLCDIPTFLLPAALEREHVPIGVVWRLMRDRLARRAEELSGGFPQLNVMMRSSWAAEWKELYEKNKELSLDMLTEVQQYLYLMGGVGENTLVDRWGYGPGKWENHAGTIFPEDDEEEWLRELLEENDV